MANIIVYWRGSAELRSELIQALSNEGEQVLTVRSLDEVHDMLGQGSISLLIADGSAGEREASARVVELTTSPKLFKIPVMFISVQATKRAAVLKNQYKTFIPVDLPFSVSDVLAKTAPVLAKRAMSDAAVSGETLAVGKGAPPQPVAVSVAGKLLARANFVEDFDDTLIIPNTNAKGTIQQALNRITDADSWLGLHARRVSFLSSAVTANLNLTPERSNTIKSAGLFLNWGLLEDWGLLQDFTNLRRMDIFLCLDREAIDALARGFERSAGFVQERLKDESAKEVIDCVAAMIQGREGGVRKELHEDAQCVMVAEFINRSCWSGGAWNSFGAYRSIKHLRSGMLRNVDSRIISAAIDSLADAISASVTMGNFVRLSPSQKQESAIEIAKATVEAEMLFDAESISNVSLTDLKPGQRVARPIASLDGQLVLHANVEIDQDIIWRLWQLGAVRALPPQVAIVTPQSAGKQLRAVKRRAKG